MEKNVFNSQIQNNESKLFLNDPKLPKASKFATIGMCIVLVATIFTSILSFVIQGQLIDFSKKNNIAYSSTSTGQLIGLAVVVIFLVLAIQMKKAKSKALPIVLIVFSAIFIAVGIFGLLTVGSVLSFYDALAQTNSLNFDSSAITLLNSIKQTVMLSIIPTLLSLVGWATTLYGGAIGTSVTKDELEANK